MIEGFIAVLSAVFAVLAMHFLPRLVVAMLLAAAVSGIGIAVNRERRNGNG